MKNKLRLIVGVLISIACVIFLRNSVEEGKVVEALVESHKGLLLLAFSVTCLSYILRAFRWKYLFEDHEISFFVSYRALMLGFFMNNVLPARIGEIVRSHAMGKSLGKSRSFVLATVAAERLADGLSISLFFLVLVYFFRDFESVPHSLYLVAWLFLCAGLGTCTILLVRKKIFSALDRLEIKISSRYLSYVLVRIKRFIIGLEPLFNLYLLSRVVLFSVVIWSTELFAYGLIAEAFSQTLGLGSLSLFLAAVNFSSLVPAAPAGLGVIEAFASGALVKTGLNREIALAMVISQHLVQIIAVGIPGLYYSFFKKSEPVSVTKDVETYPS